MIYRNKWKGATAAVLALTLVLTLFSGCTKPRQETPSTESTSGGSGNVIGDFFEELTGNHTEPSTVPETTAPTDPPATTPADGNPHDVTCQGSYTAADASASADTVVATMDYSYTITVTLEPSTEATEEGSQPTKETEPIEVEETVNESIGLTNRELQTYYWMAVASYRQAGHEVAPDFSQGLDTQPCPLDDSLGSWQQYFLREALNTWVEVQSLSLWGKLEGIPPEEAYKPLQEKHDKHLVNIPATRLLYGYNTSYQPNALHQGFLDNIPTLLADLAATYGFADADTLAQDLTGTSADTLSAYVDLYNRGYMFLTELGYQLEVTAEEVEAYYSEHEAEYTAQGINPASGKYVNMRHILLIPEGATVADNGTVTAGEEQWKNCLWDAQDLLGEINRTYPYSEGVFANAAANHSADPGSALNGGLYENLVQGQLARELDAWLFDGSRKPGDTAIIRSDCGYHIVYFSGSTEIWYATAQQDLLTRKYRELMDSAAEKYSVTVDYSAIDLGVAPQTCVEISAADLLYSDIAHERYPEAPLYLQQDYQGTRYGAYSIVTHGCGITTMAMISTYLSDTEYTPPTLCSRYGRYCSEHGTDRTLFVHAPGDLGFYLKQQVFNSSQALEALQQGYVVVCLQHEGYWTRGGHYLLLEELNENGTVLVRDSNTYNYNKLEGHYIDEHEWKTIPGNAISFWIYYPKYTSCSQCVRCSDGSTEMAPATMFQGEYQCGNCDDALLRRNTYLYN